MGTKISALTAKATPIAADTAVLVDSVGGTTQKFTLSTVPISTPIQSALDTKAGVSVLTTKASSATPTPSMGTVGANINYNLYALATVTAFQTPTGTPAHGQNLNLSIYSAATWNISFSAKYVPIKSALPGTINAGKWTYLLGRYNSTATAYHILDVFQQV